MSVKLRIVPVENGFVKVQYKTIFRWKDIKKCSIGISGDPHGHVMFFKNVTEEKQIRDSLKGYFLAYTRVFIFLYEFVCIQEEERDELIKMVCEFFEGK